MGDQQVTRQEISNKYLRDSGIGLEIAGLHNPWPIPTHCIPSKYDSYHTNFHIIQMDLFSTKELYAAYPEHAHDQLVTVHVIDDGNYCKSIATDSMDFVVSSHVLEHCENTIEAIRNWLRVVKNGGYICMAVPHKDNWIDKNREVTSVSHFFTEFRDPFYIEDVMREAHYREYLTIVDHLSGQVLEDRVKLMLGMKPRPHIHWHTFTEQSLKIMIDSIHGPKPSQSGFKLLEYHRVGHEMLVVLQKTMDGDLNWS